MFFPKQSKNSEEGAEILNCRCENIPRKMDLDAALGLHPISHGPKNQRSSSGPHHELTDAGQQSRDFYDMTQSTQSMHSSSTQHLYRPVDGIHDWDTCEMLLARELEEAKSRVLQMEKTMRWWSDCTANWREKWSKVRAERNKTREEAGQLRLQLEGTVKELTTIKKEMQELLHENEKLKADIDSTRKKGSLAVCSRNREVYPMGLKERQTLGEVFKNNSKLDMQEMGKKVLDITDYSLKDKLDFTKKFEFLEIFSNTVSTVHMEKSRVIQHGINSPQEMETLQIPSLLLQLEKLQKSLDKERESRSAMETHIKKLESDLSQWKLKYEEVARFKPDMLKQAQTHY